MVYGIEHKAVMYYFALIDRNDATTIYYVRLILYQIDDAKIF